MREIVSVHVGQCGCFTGIDFWKKIVEDFGVDHLGNMKEDDLTVFRRERINTYLKENREREHSAANCFGKGHYLEGEETCEEVLECLRKEAENCDQLDGFQLHHSLGGGTGSGLGTLLLSKLREMYPSKTMMCFSVFPSMLVSDTVVEPYNCVLSLYHLIEYADAVICLDNESLMKICQTKLRLLTPTYGDLNHLIGNSLWGLTSPFRFNTGDLNSDMRRFVYNLVPFRRTHFLTLSFSPIVTRGSCQYDTISVEDLITKMSVHNNMSSSCDPRMVGRFFASYATLRGNRRFLNPISKADGIFRKFVEDSSTFFSGWVPDNFKYSIFTKVRPKSFAASSTVVSNSSSICELMKRVGEQFFQMFRRKAFLRGFGDHGAVDEMEFTESYSNLTDLISEYQTYEGYSQIEDDEDEFETESEKQKV